jgi:GntR family transcriptional regulator
MVGVNDDARRGTLYDRMEDASVRVDGAQEHLVARRSSRNEARLLQIRAGDAVMDVRRKTFDASGSVVEVVHATYRGDRYDYVIWLERRRR